MDMHLVILTVNRILKFQNVEESNHLLVLKIATMKEYFYGMDMHLVIQTLEFQNIEAADHLTKLKELFFMEWTLNLAIRIDNRIFFILKKKPNEY